MTHLRKEYTKHKVEHERIVDEAALGWLEDNVIIVTEKINRHAVNRLVSSITKFEETFGPYKQRVPSIATVLDGAESNLQTVLTGKAGDKRTAEMLEYLSFVYNVFSSFFSKDLPVILGTKVFAAARENPTVRLDSLVMRGGPSTGFSADTALKTLAHAISPSPEETKLIGRILRSKAMPKLDYKRMAGELMGLSYADLEELTNIAKTPIITTPTEEQIQTEARNRLKEHRELLTEAASMQEVGASIEQLKQIVSKAGLTTLMPVVSDLHTKLNAYHGSDAGKQLEAMLQQATGADGNANGLADLFKTPGGKLVKQANMAIELFKTIGKAWPNVKDLINKDQPTEQDIANIKGILTKQVSGGFFKKAAQAFGFATSPYPGLEPQAVVDALTSSTAVAESKQHKSKTVYVEATPTAPAPAPTGTTSAAPATAAPAVNADALKKLGAAMQTLHKFSTSTSGGVGTTPPATTTTTAPTETPATGGGGTTAATTGTKTTQGTAPGEAKAGALDGGTAAAAAPAAGGNDQIITSTLKAVGKATDNKAKQQLTIAIKALQKAGYKITK